MVRSEEAPSALPFSACWWPPDLAHGSLCVSTRALQRRVDAHVAAMQQEAGQCCATLTGVHCASSLMMLPEPDEHNSAVLSIVLNDIVENFNGSRHGMDPRI